MKFSLIGAGSIGRRHLKNLMLLGHEPVVVFDPDSRLLASVREEFPSVGVTVSEEEAFSFPADAAIVCSPNHLHLSQSLRALRKGVHVFVEKPISHDLQETEKLIEEAAARGLAVLVACNLRFCGSLLLAKRLVDEGKIGRPLSARAFCGYYLPNWRPQRDYRQGYGAQKAKGGGIILDAIHEFDYLNWIMGDVDEVFCYAGKVSSLEIDVEDTADVLVKFSSGGVGNLHLDYLQRTYRRTCEFIGEDGVVAWDYISGDVRHYGKSDRLYEVYERNINDEINQMFIAEMKHFEKCIQKKEKPILDALGGREVLKIAMAAKESAAGGKTVSLEQMEP